MRTAAALICVFLSISSVRSETLSAEDRVALSEKLKALRDSADTRVNTRFRQAITAYREALRSNEAAIDLYYKCIEKVKYEDQQKKNAEFLEWKRKESKNLSEASFRETLRYQLRWLVLTLRASSEKADRNTFVIEAQEIVDAVFQDAKKLGPQVQILRQPVTASVFALAYKIGDLEKNDWPLSPVLLDQIYETVVFPPMRTPARLPSLRAAWIKRIQQEGIMAEEWSGGAGNKKTGTGPKDNSVQSEEFATEKLPNLQWQMEMDLFRSGDQNGASKRMLAHLEKYLSHQSARDWGEQLELLLNPPVAETAQPGE